MARILIVEDSTTQAKAIQLLLEDVGHQSTIAGNGVEALKAIKLALPDIVCTDLEMPKMNGLELVGAIRSEYPTLPVILMTAHGSDDIAALALRQGAASYVPKSYLDQDLVPTLDRVLGLTQSARSHERALECLGRIRAEFLLDNDPAQLEPVIAYQDEILQRLNFCDATERIRVSVALQEALRNASDHGNLELDSAMRQEDEQAYHDLACQRRAQSPYADRRVYFDMSITPSEATYVIRDEGAGFDPSILPDPTDSANLGKIGGRGLLIIRAFMDKVYHNSAGNEITLTKRSNIDCE